MPASLRRLDPLLGDAILRDPDIAATYAVDSSYGASAPETFTVVRARDTQLHSRPWHAIDQASLLVLRDGDCA